MIILQPVGLDRKSYDHSGKVMFLTKLNESGYAIKMFRCYFGIIVSGLQILSK